MGEEPEFNNFINKYSSGIKYTESKKRCVKDKQFNTGRPQQLKLIEALLRESLGSSD